MSGNVWEWCWDRYEAIPAGTNTDYTGGVSGEGRLWRGGSWNYDASNCTVAYRNFVNPNNQVSFNGFRVVRP